MHTNGHKENDMKNKRKTSKFTMSERAVLVIRDVRNSDYEKFLTRQRDWVKADRLTSKCLFNLKKKLLTLNEHGDISSFVNQERRIVGKEEVNEPRNRFWY